MKSKNTSSRKALGLTKSKVMTGLQCEKALYLTIHQPELADPVDASQQEGAARCTAGVLQAGYVGDGRTR